MSADDGFTRYRAEWLDKVSADVEALGHLAFHVAFKVSQHVNRQTRYAFPSQQRIANALSIDRRTVQRALDLLKDRGHLRVQSAHGRGSSNQYFMTQNSWPTEDEKAVPRPHQHEGKGGSQTAGGAVPRPH